MRHVSDVGSYLHQLHHSAVFVIQDVAMKNEFARKIRELTQYLHVASWWQREIIPPDPGPWQLNRSGAHRRIKYFNHLKRIDMDVERMRRPSGVVVIDCPLFCSPE